MAQYEPPSLEIFQPIDPDTFGRSLFTPEQESLKHEIIMLAHQYLGMLEQSIDTSPVASAPDYDTALAHLSSSLVNEHGRYRTDEHFGYEGKWSYSKALDNRTISAPVGFQTEVKLVAPAGIDPRGDHDMQTAARILMHDTTTQAPKVVHAKTLFDIEGTRQGFIRPAYTYDRGEQRAALDRAFGNRLKEREDLGLYGHVVLRAYSGDGYAAAVVLDTALESGLTRSDMTAPAVALKRAAMLLQLTQRSLPVVYA